jgi:hypothetical protein
MGNGEASGPAMGLYALAARDMFRLIQNGGEKLQSLQVFLSFFEMLVKKDYFSKIAGLGCSLKKHPRTCICLCPTASLPSCSPRSSS